MIKTEQPQNCGVQIMDVNFVFDRARAEFVRSAVGHPAFDSAACHPHAEGTPIVISARSAAGHVAIGAR